MVGEEAGEGELSEGKGAAGVGGEAADEVVVGFLHEGFLGRVLDAVDGEVEAETLEGGVLLDSGEGLLQGLWAGVGGEGFDGGAGRGAA